MTTHITEALWDAAAMAYLLAASALMSWPLVTLIGFTSSAL